MKMTRAGGLIRITLICTLLAVNGCLLIGCGKADASAYDGYLRAACEAWHFQGVALVACGDSIVFRQGYGKADIESGRDNTVASKFPLGSITKQFTAAAVLQLADRGRIDLNEFVSSYLSDYPHETGERITIHHLLSHTSGIPSVNQDLQGLMMADRAVAPEELVQTFEHLPLEFEPGSRYAYSNCGYVLLGRIIEAVSGMPYDDYIAAHILKPLGMSRSGMFYDYAERSDFARGYQMRGDGMLKKKTAIHLSMGYSAGALCATAGDLFIWHRALSDTVLLKAETIRKMFTPNLGDYGYGWLIRDNDGHRVAAHAGGSPGYSTWIERWLDDSLLVVVFSNNVNASVGTIAGSLARIAQALPYDMPARRTATTLPPETIAEYAGVYEMTDGRHRIITVDDNKLLSRLGNGPAVWLIPEARDRFYFAHDDTVTLDFTRGEDGRVVGHVVRWIGGEAGGRKLSAAEAAAIGR